MNRTERWVMRQLLNQWAHPEFASIPGFQSNLSQSPFQQGSVATDDWTPQTLPSGSTPSLKAFAPGAVLSLGPKAVIQGLRETPTLLLMHWAFATGLMQFGVFRMDR